MTRVTRVEVIDHRSDARRENNRSLVVWDETMNVELSYQDGGRTLKVFLDTAPSSTAQQED